MNSYHVTVAYNGDCSYIVRADCEDEAKKEAIRLFKEEVEPSSEMVYGGEVSSIDKMERNEEDLFDDEEIQKFLKVRVPSTIKIRFKQLCAEKEISMQEMITKLIYGELE